MREIDPTIPVSPPPEPRTPRVTVYSMPEERSPVISGSLPLMEPPPEQYLPAVVDPLGEVAEIDGRQVTESEFYRYGFNHLTYGEIAKLHRASVMWVSTLMKKYGWTAEAYSRGLADKDQETVVVSERSMRRLIEGHTLTEEKLDRFGSVHQLEKEIGPNGSAAQFVLERRAPERYAKEREPDNKTVNITIIGTVNQMLKQKGIAPVEITESTVVSSKPAP